MLILNRKKNERIIITTPAGERIEVVVVEFRGVEKVHKVRLGVIAPKDVTIHRAEIQAKVDAQGAA